MKKIIIIGAGGSTKVLIDMLAYDRRPLKILGILDDDPAKTGKTFAGVRILGTTGDLPKLKHRFDEVLIGVGATKDTETRNRLFEKIKKGGFKFYSAMAKQCFIAPSAVLGAGCILMPGTIVNAGAVLEDNVFVNSGSIVEHDCRIGRSSFLGPGSIISGYTAIGHNTFVGSGAIVSGSLRIGNNVTIGAGSVIVRDIPDNVLCFGNPAHRNIRKKT